MSVKDTLRSVELKLSKEKPLFLGKFKSEFSFGDWEMKDFILDLLVSLSEDNETRDSATGAVTCKKARRRSLGDIYQLCRYYYNDVTLEEVQLCLAELHKEKKIGYFYCNSTKKRVYMSIEYYNTHHYNPTHYGSPDEWGITPANLSTLTKYKKTNAS